MVIIEKLLSINKYSRPGRMLNMRLGLIYHYVGIRNQRPKAVWDYFEKDCPRLCRYSSAHYCIDLDGTNYQFIPDNEVAYHCGTENIDPKSQRIYSDWARERFPSHTNNPAVTSPNMITLGIELCFSGVNGEFTEATLASAAELGASLCVKYGIPINNVGTHHQVVGWKECPLFWAKRPEEFEKFKSRLANLISAKILR
jgi:N-acetylmuramoyl-L-alanine amidase